MRRTSRPAPFEYRGCGLPVIVFRSCGAFTEHRVDVWYSRCHSQAQPSRNPYPPDLLIRLLRPMLPPVGIRNVDLGVEGLLLHQTGEGSMGISPRIPSIVLRTCKPKPTDHARETFKGLANTRTVSPSVHSRSSSEGSVSFFLASALSVSPTGLATSRWRRRAMRPTDLCHPNDLRAPAPRELPASHHTFAWGAPRRVLGSARYYWGIERFTAAHFFRFGGSSFPHFPSVIFCG